MNKGEKTFELSDEALLSKQELPYNVPKNWIWVKLKTINKKKSRNIEPNDFSDEIFELYSVPSYPENSPEFIKGEEIGSSKQVVYKNEVLLCKINPRINRVWKVFDNKGEYRQLASTEWIVISENKGVYPDYLLYLLKSPYFRKLITSNVSGVGGSLTRARPKEVESYPIALPPLNEQKRIAKKVERLLNKLEEAGLLIEEAKETFELRSAAIIKSILREGLSDNKLPVGWRKIKVKNLFNIFGGGTPSKAKEEYWNGRIPWISAKDMKSTYISETMDYITDLGLKNSSAKLAKKGSIAMVVRSGILQRTLPVAYLLEECTVNQDLKIFDSGNEIINKYFMWYVKGNEKSLLHNYSKSGTTVNSIEFEKFKSHELLLPPIEMLKRKVEKIESTIEKEENINRILNISNSIELLKQSILSKAFRGELGTNDPSEENAIELLKEVLNNK
jgi:type I restriction enzyme, S subunit